MNKAINIVAAFVAVALFYQMKLHKWTDLHGKAREEFLPEFLIGVNWTTSLDHMVNKWQTACGGTKERTPSDEGQRLAHKVQWQGA